MNNRQSFCQKHVSFFKNVIREKKTKEFKTWMKKHQQKAMVYGCCKKGQSCDFIEP